MNRVEEARNLLATIGVIFTEEQHKIIDTGVLTEDTLACREKDYCSVELNTGEPIGHNETYWCVHVGQHVFRCDTEEEAKWLNSALLEPNYMSIYRKV